MKKILLLFVILSAFFSCDDDSNKPKTAQDYMREERIAIERFIEENNFDIIEEYPEDGVFKEKQFYKTNTGLYIHVVDSGNGKSPIALRTRVKADFEYMLDIKSYMAGEKDTITQQTGGYQDYYINFLYGIPGSYGRDSEYNLSCDGFALPFHYITENAIVDLIIPSSLGKDIDNESFTPRFYKNVFYKDFYQ